MKNQKNRKKIIFFITSAITIFYFIGYFSLVLDWTEMHEIVHQTIYASYGIKSKISYELNFPYFIGKTTPVGSIKNCTENCEILHNLNEIVSYNLDSITNILFLIGLIIIILLGFIWYEISEILERISGWVLFLLLY